MRHDDITRILRSLVRTEFARIAAQTEKEYELISAWHKDEIADLRDNMRRVEGRVKDLYAALKVAGEYKESARILSGEPVRAMVEKAAEITGVPVKKILSKSRLRDVVGARDLAMYMAHQIGYSSPVIGRFLKRDHSSVLRGIGREAERRAAKEVAA